MKIYVLMKFESNKMVKIISKRPLNLKSASLPNLRIKSKKNILIEQPAPIEQPTKVEPVVDSNTQSNDEEDREDYIDALDPVLIRLKREKAAIRGKQKFSYLTEIFYASLVKNYHDKERIKVAINRFRKIKKTIEENNDEITNIMNRLEELKKSNEKFTAKHERVLKGYSVEESQLIKEELAKINDLTEQMQQN